MTVLIAIPVGPGIPGPMLDNAVKHALGQTQKDVVVLVVGDGLQPPVSVTDDRLVVGKFPVNRGVAFTQQAMLLGSPFTWYAPHGADDWLEPNHVASLLALKVPIAGSSRIWYHKGPRPQQLHSPRTWIEFGVWDTAAVRSIGGYNPAEPFGQDSVLITILMQTQKVRTTRLATYHKRYRPDSLTRAPATRGGSPARTAVRVRNRAILTECAKLGWKPPAVRAYRDSVVPDDVRKALERSTALVAKWLG